MAIRPLGTCRILGNGFAMLRSVSHHLELAHCAFTRSQGLDEQVTLSVTRSGAPLSTLSSLLCLERSLPYSMRMVQHYMPGWMQPTVCDPGRMRRIRSHDNCAAATAVDARLLWRVLRKNIAHRLGLEPGTELMAPHRSRSLGDYSPSPTVPDHRG